MGETPDPFKRGEISPLRLIPGCASVTTIKTDVMHTFNLGFGGDLASSTIVLLGKLGVFEGRSLAARLDHAYDSFSLWCTTHHKTPSTKSFEKSRFHMKVTLGSHQDFPG